jgi:hypothetical protein
MDLQAITNVSQIVASAAVLVTLVYLAVQIRQAKQQIALGGRQARADAARAVLASVSETEFLAPIFAKLPDFPWGEFGLESREDTARFSAWCHAWMRTEEHNFRALPSQERPSQDQLLLMWLSTSWGASFWEQVKAIYDADFAAYVDSLQRRLKENPRPTMEIFRAR